MEFSRQEEVLTISTRMTVSKYELKDVMGKHFPKMYQLVLENGKKVTGQPFTIYRLFEGENLDIELGMPISEHFETQDYEFSKLPTGSIAKCQYYGPYSDLDKGYSELSKWVKKEGKESSLPYWEIYVSDPMSVEDLNELRTDIHTKLK